MKKFYTVLLLATLCFAPEATAQQTTQTTIDTGVAASPAMLKAPSRADETVTTNWVDYAGKWTYYSNYTKKSYPTTVRSRQILSASYNRVLQTQYEMTNQLYGTAILKCTTEGGVISITDKDGQTPVEILNSDGTGSGKYAYAPAVSNNRVVANIMQYAASEDVAMAVTVVSKTASGEYDYENATNVSYDYFINDEGQKGTVSVTIPRLTDTRLSLTGSCAAGVTDLYYVVGISLRDQDLADANPDIANQYGFPVNYASMQTMLTDYIATGKMNSAVKIGKIALDGHKRFEVTIPETWEGQRPVSLFALKDGVVCAQHQQIVEMRRTSGWKAYKDLDLSLDLTFSLPHDPISVNKNTTMDINEEAKLLRINNPFSDIPSTSNYIYLDYSLGMDKVFVADSYAPVYYSTTTTNTMFEEQTVTDNPFFFRSFVSCNISQGFTPAQLYDTFKEYGWFFDLTVEAPRIAAIMQTAAYYYYTNGIYAQGSGTLEIGMTDMAGVKVNEDYTLTVFMGADVSDAEIAFVNQDDLSITSKTYSFLNSNDGLFEASFDIAEAIIAKEIPEGANAVRYAFKNKAGVEVKSGILPVTLDLQATFATVEFENYGAWNVSGTRRCTLTATSSGNPLVTLYDFTESQYFYQEDNTLQIEFINGEPDIKTAYFGNLNFSNIGDCDVYIMAKDATRALNVVSAVFGWNCYQNGENVTTWATTPGTITLPADWDLETGIDAVEALDAGDFPAEYFNLQGQHVASPVKGNLYIERRGTSTRKIVF